MNNNRSKRSDDKNQQVDHIHHHQQLRATAGASPNHSYNDNADGTRSHNHQYSSTANATQQDNSMHAPSDNSNVISSATVIVSKASIREGIKDLKDGINLLKEEVRRLNARVHDIDRNHPGSNPRPKNSKPTNKSNSNKNNKSIINNNKSIINKRTLIKKVLLRNYRRNKNDDEEANINLDDPKSDNCMNRTTLSTDTYSLMTTKRVWSYAWFYSSIIYAIQMLLLIMIFIQQCSKQIIERIQDRLRYSISSESIHHFRSRLSYFGIRRSIRRYLYFCHGIVRSMDFTNTPMVQCIGYARD